MKYFFFFVAVCLLASTLTSTAQQTKNTGKEIGTVTEKPILTSPNHTLLDIFSEGFNDTSATGFPPMGWIMINRDGNSDPTDTAWYQSLTVGGTGGPGPYEGVAFAADYYGTANGFYIDDYLITPNTGGTPPPGSVDSLTFWSASRLSSSGNYPDSLEIRVSTTGTNVNDFTDLLDFVLVPKAQWTRFAYELPMAANRYIAFRYLIYDGGPSGTNSDKVCLDDVRITRYPSTDVTAPGQSPVEFSLSQNYPNPFNPSTTIRFQLKEGAQTTLNVYDVLGEKVVELVNENLSSGLHAVVLDGKNLSSGLYYYRLMAGSFVATKSMIVLK